MIGKEIADRQLVHPDEFLDHLAELFARDDSALDEGGRLSNGVHMLQTAAAAEAANAEASLVAASLLHDIGHWLRGEMGNAQSEGDRHESVGADYLMPFFGKDVTQPIALHVAAKRYLCTRDPEYLAKLSPGSVRSLAVQGGPMSEREVRTFEANSAHARAVALRRWDEYGKIPELKVADFDHYRPLLRSLMRVR